jgi:hypothetical protein
MFVPRKKWNKLQNKIDRLESKLLELKSEQEIKTGISTIKFTDVLPYRGFKTVPLWLVMKMILSHLNLEITEEPAKEAKFKLAAKEPEKESEVNQ